MLLWFLEILDEVDDVDVEGLSVVLPVFALVFVVLDDSSDTLFNASATYNVERFNTF